MAGAASRISIEIESAEVRRTLQALLAAAGDLKPAFADIGEHLLISHRERWQRHVDPEGRPWRPLSPAYKERKKRNRDRILVLNNYLLGTVRYQVTDAALETGTDRVYGATHQFGRPERHIPPRPWLGVSAEDETEILAILTEHLKQPGMEA